MNTGKQRNITLSISEAKEFYKSGVPKLRDLALRVFSEEELTSKVIRCWKDVEDWIVSEEGRSWNEITREMTEGQEALMKLWYIRKVLNEGQKMSLTEGTFYLPTIRFITKECKIYEGEDDIVKLGTIQTDNGSLYDVISIGNYDEEGYDDGLGEFRKELGVGYCGLSKGFLGCSSLEIAKEMSENFGREIFDAMFRDYVNYKWV